MKPKIWKVEVRRRVRPRPGEPLLEIPTKLEIPLGFGNSVMWCFELGGKLSGLPGLVPSRESGQTARNPLGPFTMLQYGEREIYASGASGVLREFSYRAVLHEAGTLREIASSNQGRLVFCAPDGRRRVSQEVTVTLRLTLRGQATPQPSLQISPEKLQITPGSPVTWNFSVPTDLFGDMPWFPEILFAPGGGHYGPFESISALVMKPIGAAGQAHPTGIRLVGAGANGHVGSFGYTCRISTLDGVYAISSGDPAVANDGELQTPPDTEPG